MAEEDFISDDPMILAGEYALRVLEGEELVAAQRRVLSDPEFAEAVTWWEYRLAYMAEDASPMAPSAAVWPAIAARLGGQPGSAPAASPIRLPSQQPAAPSGWSIALAGTGIAAMIAAAFIAMPGTGPVPAPGEPAIAQPAEQLIAQLASEDGATRLAGRVDPATGQLALTTQGFPERPRQAPELWVVPAGGAPVSLGLIPAEGRFDRELTDAERALLVPGATLAVTMEERASAPHDAPSSEILIAGALDLI